MPSTARGKQPARFAAAAGIGVFANLRFEFNGNIHIAQVLNGRQHAAEDDCAHHSVDVFAARLLPTGSCIVAGLLANIPTVFGIGTIAPDKDASKKSR